MSDLVGDWGNHREIRPTTSDTDSEALAWQVHNLDLSELVHALTTWSGQMPDEARQAALLKLATAAAVAAADGATPDTVPGVSSTLVNRLTGTWTSSYHYPSTSRAGTFEGVHTVELRPKDGRIVGVSLPDDSGSDLTLSLSVDGTLVTGHWRERTSPWGHYRAAVYSGLVQLVVDPTATTMSGRWLGIGKRYTIKSGEWRMERTVHPDVSPGPVTTRTTVDDVSSPSAISR